MAKSDFKVGAEVVARNRGGYFEGAKTSKVLKVYANGNVVVEGYGNQQWRVLGVGDTLTKAGKSRDRWGDHTSLDLATPETLAKAREDQASKARRQRLYDLKHRVDNVGRQGHPQATDEFLDALEAAIKLVLP